MRMEGRCFKLLPFRDDVRFEPCEFQGPFKALKLSVLDLPTHATDKALWPYATGWGEDQFLVYVANSDKEKFDAAIAVFNMATGLFGMLAYLVKDMSDGQDDGEQSVG